MQKPDYTGCKDYHRTCWDAYVARTKSMFEQNLQAGQNLRAAAELIRQGEIDSATAREMSCQPWVPRENPVVDSS